MTPEPSPLWQYGFVAWAVIVVLWSMWSGWRKGLVRTLVSLVGLVAGGIVATAVSAAAPPLLAWLIPLPKILIGLVAGLIAGFATWIGIGIMGALLFKKTNDHSFGIVRWIWGIGGAFIGAAIGVTIVWGGLLFVRGLGSFEEPRFSEIAQYYNLPKPGVFETTVVRLKRSLEQGDVGEVFAAIDVMPDRTYEVLNKVGRLSVDPVAAQRFFQVPEIKEVLDSTNFQALLTDPDVEEAARSGRIQNVFSNPKVVAAANDPEFIAKLQKIDFEAALDHALADQPAEPARQ